jgi:hypothetical protein
VEYYTTTGFFHRVLVVDLAIDSRCSYLPNNMALVSGSEGMEYALRASVWVRILLCEPPFTTVGSSANPKGKGGLNASSKNKDTKKEEKACSPRVNGHACIDLSDNPICQWATAVGYSTCLYMYEMYII